MAKTAKLALPYIEAAQAQKHVTHNEAIRALDALVQISVIANDLATPPSGAQEGDRYVVAPNGAGDWSGQDSKLAAWQDGTWAFYQPQTGWIIWVEDEAMLKVFDGNSWLNLNSDGGEAISTELNPAPLIGVNSIADASNRLSVASPGSLFTHEGSDHRVIINKAAAEDTASMVFQTSYSGRAEFGLSGDDDWHVKVSNDGSSWHEAMIANRNNGQVRFPNSVLTNVGVKTFDSGSGTYVPVAGVVALKVTCIGGGGGGAGAATTSSSLYCSAGGGGAGAAVIKWISNQDLVQSYTFSVGAGGNGGSAPDGAAVGSRDGDDGMATTFSGGNVTMLANGGGGAPEDRESSGPTQFEAGNGGAASGGDINIAGSNGFGGVTLGVNKPQNGVGFGASTIMGIGGPVKNGPGVNGTGYGSGGSGAGMLAGFVLNRDGGNGAPGLIIIEEYF